jgi:hypothetical protein
LTTIASRSPQAQLASTPWFALEAFGVISVRFEEIAALRKAQGPWERTRLLLSLMKHGDHQTVLALAAVFRAIHDFGWHARSFTDWGVVAAPRFIGRIVLAGALDRFERLGVAGMSPLIIPTLSLHAVASSVSLALKAQGPSLGAGGGHGHLGEGLLAAVMAHDHQAAAGIWVVATAFDPEPVPDSSEKSPVPAVGYGVALALTLGQAATSTRTLRLVATSRVGQQSQSTSELVALAEFLAHSGATVLDRRWSCCLPGIGEFELLNRAASVREHSQAR